MNGVLPNDLSDESLPDDLQQALTEGRLFPKRGTLEMGDLFIDDNVVLQIVGFYKGRVVFYAQYLNGEGLDRLVWDHADIVGEYYPPLELMPMCPRCDRLSINYPDYLCVECRYPSP